MDARQVKDNIILPALTALGMKTPNAVNLMLGTMAQESEMGKFIVQQGIGMKGGIGVYQMQAPTYMDLWKRIIQPSTALRAKIRLMLCYDVMPPAERMASDIMLATLMTRIYYYAIPQPLPDKDDIIGLGTYWKEHYNTLNGAGSIQEFTDAYYRLVKKSLQ